jgi:hypothetical protein
MRYTSMLKPIFKFVWASNKYTENQIKMMKYMFFICTRKMVDASYSN